jgi:hypothetical protein
LRRSHLKKTDRYRQILRTLDPDDWESFLLEESGLPGPRGNLELAHAVADEGDEAIFRRLLSWGPDRAPTNSPHEFLAVCGTVGLGKLLAEGQSQVLEELRLCASDPRWRTREGVAMALQRFGKVDMAALLQAMERWSEGSLLEMRAAAAGLCEPDLLYERKHAERVLGILDRITRRVCSVEERKSEDFRVLRKALGYCWSVAVVALPDRGKATMEQWFFSDDKDVVWIMRENLRKKRLARMDAEWVERWKVHLGMAR